jgi:hypothetical protein
MSITEPGSVQYVGESRRGGRKVGLRETETTPVAMLQNPGTSVLMLGV